MDKSVVLRAEEDGAGYRLLDTIAEFGAERLTAAAGGPPPAGQRAARRAPGLLTSREEQVATLVAQGLPNRDMARRLGISKRTVDAHIDHIFGELGISSRVQLATWLSGGSVPDGRGGLKAGAPA